jgi:hypothetical protein
LPLSEKKLLMILRVLIIFIPQIWMFMYHILDYFFLVFHLCIVLFNLFGWILKPTRKANLVLLLLTAFSWFGLGIFYGMGYCPFTEWHWQVLERLGSRPVETSYMQYIYRRLFGLSLDSQLVDFLTAASFAAALLASLYFNLRDFCQKKK